MTNNLEIFLDSYANGIEPKETLFEESENKKPYGYWRNWENVEAEINKIIEEIGHFPSQNEMKSFGQYTLPSAIANYHSGVNAVRKKMEYEIEKRDNGYWNNWENVEKELKEIIEKIGHFPSQLELRKLKMSSLSPAIDKHGGTHVVSKKLGMTGVEKFPKGYWQDEENVLSEYKKITEELGHAPSNNELCKLGYAGLSDSISKNYGSIFEIRNKLEIETDRKENGYWTLEKILELSREAVEEYGFLPPYSELRKNDKYKELSTAINKNFGIEKIRKKLRVVGLENPSKKKKDGYWNKKNTFKEAKKIYGETGSLPSSNDLVQMGHKSLTFAIIKYYGFSEIRKKLGLDQLRNPNGYWTDKKIIEECKKIIKEHGDVITKVKLKDLGYSSLESGISHKNSGYSYYRNILGLNENKKPLGYWREWENVERELKNIIEEIGHFPSQKELNSHGIGALSNSVHKNFYGIVSVRERMGYEIIKRRDGYWTKETVYEEVLSLARRLGHFPTHKERKKNDIATVDIYANKYFSSMQNLRDMVNEELKINENSLEEMLKNYLGENNE